MVVQHVEQCPHVAIIITRQGTLRSLAAFILHSFIVVYTFNKSESHCIDDIN